MSFTPKMGPEVGLFTAAWRVSFGKISSLKGLRRAGFLKLNINEDTLGMIL